jgi:phosphohistidine phosphatase
MILLRHADAQWPAYSGRDFDRPLTETGMATARTAAMAIQATGYQPTLILASPARRTQQTAQIVAATLGVPDASIRYVDALYNGSADTLEAALHQAQRQAGALILVAHNPGISELAQRLGGRALSASLQPAQWLQVTYPAAS